MADNAPKDISFEDALEWWMTRFGNSIGKELIYNTVAHLVRHDKDGHLKLKFELILSEEK